jgi:drug/metabolite transporter (DMT)-like permease
VPWNLVGVLLTYILTNFCLASLTQQQGLDFLKAWEMASILQTVPLFSTVFAVLLLHDSMTLLQAGGGLLAILGGLIVSLPNQKPPALPAAGGSVEQAQEQDYSSLDS